MTMLELSQVLGNWGEFIGAIAVVVTLVYLARQVKHSMAATEANTRRTINVAFSYTSRDEMTRVRKVFSMHSVG